MRNSLLLHLFLLCLFFCGRYCFAISNGTWSLLLKLHSGITFGGSWSTISDAGEQAQVGSFLVSAVLALNSPLEVVKVCSSGSGLGLCKENFFWKGTRKKGLMSDVESRGLNCLTVQVNGLYSKLQNEKVLCDMFSHDHWYLIYCLQQKWRSMGC